jgi:DNA-binding Xre family transcriptional regulator
MKTKINELCRAVGITTAYQLQKATNLSPSQAARLYKDDVEAISLSVLEKLCDTLKCSPNAIFDYDAPGVAKHQIVKPGEEKPASTPETPKKAASGDGMTVQQVRERLRAATGKKLSRERISNYISNGRLRTTQLGGQRRAHEISETDYLEFEAWYKENILKQK